MDVWEAKAGRRYKQVLGSRPLLGNGGILVLMILHQDVTSEALFNNENDLQGDEYKMGHQFFNFVTIMTLVPAADPGVFSVSKSGDPWTIHSYLA